MTNFIEISSLLPDLQKIINYYVFGNTLYNKCLCEYKSKIHYDENYYGHCGTLIIGERTSVSSDWEIANYRDFNGLIEYRTIYNFSYALKDVWSTFDAAKPMSVLPKNY